MNIAELFRRLSYGELSNLSIGSEGSGTVSEASRPKLIAHTNEALLRLYSRFVLKENNLILQLSDFITNYHFLKRFAQSNSNPILGDTLYIIDNDEDTFKDDLIKVLQVTNAIGERLPLNDPDDPWSLFTPQPNLLQVPFPVEEQVIGIVYQARHNSLPYDNVESIIELPVVLEGALTAYIAYKVFSHMNGQEHSMKATEYLNQFDGICQEIVDRDLVNSSSSSTGEKFYLRGFV